MPKPLDPASLPDDIAQAAQAQVAAGRFASIEDVIRAGVSALADVADAHAEWLTHARALWRAGVAASTRGEAIEATPAEHMQRIRARIEAPRT